MSILKNIGKSVERVIDKIEQKNHLAAQVNRIRSIMKREQKAAEKEYITLGRYYYQNLRDENNAVTEKHCAEIDQLEKKIHAAMDELEKTYYEAAKHDEDSSEEISLEDVVVLDEPPVLENTDLPFADSEK